MSKFPVQDDLMEFSKTDSPDEERLLQLYRNCTRTERNEILCRLTRLRLSPEFETRRGAVLFGDESHYLYEELEDRLRQICPRDRLKQLGDELNEPQFNGLWDGAWGGIADVILGLSENDGQRADELYAEVARIAKNFRLKEYSFSRKEALDLIETWRETALRLTFEAGRKSERP